MRTKGDPMPSVTHPVTAPPRTGDPPARRWLTLAVVSVSMLVVGLDTTVLNVALPTLVGELGASTSQLQWIVDSYALMSGSLVLFCGSLADRLGRKWIFMSGLALFTAASVLAAYAGSVTTLVLARGAMGVGEALIMPPRSPSSGRCSRARRTHQGDRHLVGGRRRRDGDRADGRRLAAEPLLVGLGVPDQSPPRCRGPDRRRAAGARLPRPRERAAGPGRGPAVRRGRGECAVGGHRRARPRLDEPRGADRLRGGRPPADRLRRLAAQVRLSHAAAPDLPAPCARGR